VAVTTRFFPNTGLRVAPSLDDVRDLELLIRANHSLIVLETDEPERAEPLVRWVADRLDLPFVGWSPDRGLHRPDMPGFAVEGSTAAAKCLDYVLAGKSEVLYLLEHFFGQIEEPALAPKLVQVAHQLSENRGAVLITAPPGAALPQPLQRLCTTLKLAPPTPAEYYDFVRELLADLTRRMPLKVKLSSEEVGRLISHLQGLTLFEVKKILTKLAVEDGTLNGEDIPRIAHAKKEIVARSGVLEYFAAEERMDEVAGLGNLKAWLAKRKPAFAEPDRARQFGLSPPRGILLIGVQGCGKSMCAKAIAREWELPLIRLDPSNLYNKYFGESEKNLKRATRTAEAMAPIVLWIDEMEKAFAQGGQDDSGTTTRVFGSFLTWMQEKKASVFVVATSNDISRLPPELVRKGRFDEIFFVDLPSAEARAAILAVHLRRRGRSPERYALADLAARMDGFSGAEIEQVVLSALYTAFAHGQELSDLHLTEEIGRTVPLSVTMAEPIAELREWARQRAVPAES
jgi:ATPase family associated with various cellular activities (AAA)